LEEQRKNRPNDTFLLQNWVPQVEAAIAIKQGKPSAALAPLQAAAPFEPGDIGATFYRGLAYLSMKSGKEAAAEFRKVLDRKTINPASPLHAISRLQLARALALSGDTDGARTAYQDLFALWKDADPDLPVLKQAKDEYGRLH